MGSWRRRARLGVALFGLVFAAIVYFAIGERPDASPPEPVRRFDPTAVLETTGANVQQLSGAQRDFEIQSARIQYYADGSTRQFDVRITVPNRNGRDYLITAAEGFAGAGQTDLRLSGGVRLMASDGFALAAADATFDNDGGVLRSPGRVSFSKGRLRGAGVGMTYDQPHDVLRFDAESAVTTTGDDGRTVLDFSADAATLDRTAGVLTLDGGVHVLRDMQVIEADRVAARLSQDEAFVTYLELRGNARVSGGDTPIARMSARDIDLDYTDDGATLERVMLAGSGEIAMAGGGEAAGRRYAAESLDLQLAADGSVTSAVGREAVRVDLPAGGTAPARRITAEAFDAAGEPGRDLTRAVFTSAACDARAREACVEFREEPGEGGGARIARAARLDVQLAEGGVTAAVFTGHVDFDAAPLRASAAEARYEPDGGRLRLTSPGAPRPSVRDEQVAVEAQAIDVTLEGPRIAARGRVATTLHAGEAGETGTGAPRLPRLLEAGTPVHVNADALEYDGAGGVAVYTGGVVLSQGTATTIRADRIAIDREAGALVATGDARAAIELDTGRSVGRAHEIRYDDESRVIRYSPAPLAPTHGDGPGPEVRRPEAPRGGGAAAAGAPPARVQLNGPDGDVTARQIAIVLAAAGSSVERLEAESNVRIVLGRREAAGERLIYHAAGGRYVLEAGVGAPVRIVDRTGSSCSETTGRTLTFFKATDTMIVDGSEFARTQTTSGGSCGPAPASR